MDRTLLVRKSDVIKSLEISRTKLDGLIRSGAIRVVRLGPRCVRIETAELSRLIAERAVAGGRRS